VLKASRSTVLLKAAAGMTERSGPIPLLRLVLRTQPRSFPRVSGAVSRAPPRSDKSCPLAETADGIAKIFLMTSTRDGRAEFLVGYYKHIFSYRIR
jgi:hypothetical protein